MSYEASGSIGAGVAALAGGAALVIAGTCIAAGTGLYIGCTAIKKAIQKEIQRRQEEERQRQAVLRNALLQLDKTIGEISSAGSIAPHLNAKAQARIKETSEQAKMAIEDMRIEKKFLQKRLEAIRKSSRLNIPASSGATSSAIDNIQQFLKSDDKQAASVEATSSKFSSIGKSLQKYKTMIDEWDEALKAGGSAVNKPAPNRDGLKDLAEECGLALTYSGSRTPDDNKIRQIEAKRSDLEAVYQTFVSDVNLGGFMLASKEGEAFLKIIADIDDCINANKTDAIDSLFDNAEDMKNRLCEAFASRYNGLWGEVIEGAAESVLKEMGYNDSIESENKNGRHRTLGFRGITEFKFEFDEQDGSINLDLGEDAFSSQQECTKEVEKFIEKMSEKGIILDLESKREKYGSVPCITGALSGKATHGNTADEIKSALIRAGWACDAVEEGDIVTLTIKNGYSKRIEKVNKEHGMERVKEIINSMDAGTASHEQFEKA